MYRNSALWLFEWQRSSGVRQSFLTKIRYFHIFQGSCYEKISKNTQKNLQKTFPKKLAEKKPYARIPDSRDVKIFDSPAVAVWWADGKRPLRV